MRLREDWDAIPVTGPSYLKLFDSGGHNWVELSRATTFSDHDAAAHLLMIDRYLGSPTECYVDAVEATYQRDGIGLEVVE